MTKVAYSKERVKFESRDHNSFMSNFFIVSGKISGAGDYTTA